MHVNVQWQWKNYGVYGQTAVLIFFFPKPAIPQTSDLWSFLPQPYLMKHKKDNM